MTGNYFRVLGVVAGVRPRLRRPRRIGRGTPVHVAVVSHAFWQNRLGASPSAIGREIELNGSRYVVIGVAPPAVRRRHASAAHPTSGCRWRFSRKCVRLRRACAVPSAAPICSASAGRAGSASWRGLDPRAPRPQRTAALDVLARRLQRGVSPDQRPACLPCGRARRGPGRADLDAPDALSARGLGRAGAADRLRQRHQPAGGALGLTAPRNGGSSARSAPAGRRLIRQWLTESVLLALLGGLCGLVLARWGAPLLHVAGHPSGD